MCMPAITPMVHVSMEAPVHIYACTHTGLPRYAKKKKLHLNAYVNTTWSVTHSKFTSNCINFKYCSWKDCLLVLLACLLCKISDKREGEKTTGDMCNRMAQIGASGTIQT